MATIQYEIDGEMTRMSGSYYRGARPQFYPEDKTLARDSVVDRFLVKGWMPESAFISTAAPIVAFGSCFAANISNYLHKRGYNVLTKKEGKAYITTMGDGMVHTHAIRQQFEWAWENKVPEGELWTGYNSEEFGYDEDARLETKQLFDAAEVFVITLGLSELWYDEPTGEVFWRQPPDHKRDLSRHKFRVATYEETIANLRAIHRLIRVYRPDAAVIVTVSPIPLRATFRQISCISANAVSKAILRAAVDQVYRELSGHDPKFFYFPSYDVVMYAFNHQWTEDRRHVYGHILDFNMKIFERYFCSPGIGDDALLKSYKRARALDLRIAIRGHSVIAKVTDQKRQLRIEKRKQARSAIIAEKREARRNFRVQLRKNERALARAGKTTTLSNCSKL